MERPLIMPKPGRFTRKELPQLGPSDEFLANIRKHGIKYKEGSFESHKLMASQSEFHPHKIRAIMKDPKPSKTKVIISKDDHILDGHHRWIVNLNRGTNTRGVQVDLPIIDLIALSKTFENSSYKDIGAAIGRVVKECLARKNYK